MKMGKGILKSESELMKNKLLNNLRDYKKHKQEAEESEHLARLALKKAIEQIDGITSS